MSDMSQLRIELGGLDACDTRTRTALVVSVWDGAFATMMLGIVETFGVAAAVALDVPCVLIALLGTFPTWLGALAQLALRQGLIGPARKPWVVSAVRAQATMLLLLVLTGWAPLGWAAPLYVFAFMLYGATNAAVGHLWISWLSDVCPENILGRHMAWRSAIFACVQLSTTAAAGWLARGFTNRTATWSLYALAFSVAAAARYASGGFLSRQYEPPIVAELPRNRPYQPPVALARFAKAIALFNGAALLAGPFFNVWFLRDLGFGYLAFAMAGVSSLAGTLVANRFVGTLADKVGATPILKFGAVFAALSPVTYLWIDRPWQVWLANFGSGIAWASVNLAAFKYLVQAVRKGPERSGFVYANLWLTTTVLVMSLVGGLLAPHLPTLFTWPLQTLFLLSALARVAVVAVFFARLVDLEPRQHAARVYNAALCQDG